MTKIPNWGCHFEGTHFLGFKGEPKGNHHSKKESPPNNPDKPTSFSTCSLLTDGNRSLDRPLLSAACFGQGNLPSIDDVSEDESSEILEGADP